jgi:glycosyltransferase involved in cell wall biosynthesis/SAM-dependent methyltransferase
MTAVDPPPTVASVATAVTVTVIVPVRDEAASLARCLASLLAQDFPAARMEILVVDGMSADGSDRVARDAVRGATTSVRVIANPRRTAAAAMNLGIREARGDVIVRLDGHAEAAPDFVRRSVEALERTGADCVGGPIETVGEGATGRAIALAMSSRFGVGGAAFRTGGNRETDVDTVAFGAYRRSAFERAGPFDETFVRNQDDEFHLRLTRAGGRIVLVPGVRSTYRCRGSLGALARQYFGYGFWKPRVLVKHGRLPAVRALVPPAFVAALVASVVVAIVAREPRWLLAVAWPYAVANLAASLVAAAPAAWSVLPGLPAAFATLHVAYGLGFWAGLFSPRRGDELERIGRFYSRRDAAARPAESAVLLDARRRDVRALLTAAGLLPSASARILDVGCGRGGSLATERAAVYGVDLVPARVAAARDRLPHARFAVADAGLLPFRGGSFDLCLLFTVMSSMRDAELRRRVAGEALRVVREGGAVVVYDFAFHAPSRDVGGVSPRALRRLFPGCRVTSRRTCGPVRWLPTHYVALVRRAEETR